MIRLLAGQLDRHCDGGVLRDGNDQLWANFLTTLVRYYFALALAPPAHPSRGLALGLATTPMPLLGRMAPLLALSIMTPIDAVNMAPLLSAIQATGLLTLAPVGLIPTGLASLCWTHYSAINRSAALYPESACYQKPS